MSKLIYCYKCAAYLGEIKDARLKKNIKFSCDKCKPKEKDSRLDLLKDLFHMK